MNNRVSKSAVSASALLLIFAAAAQAVPPLMRPFDELLDREATRAAPSAGAHPDTVWFGGGGAGDGSVVRGGTWTWEADSGEPPQFFPDGDPVGNAFRDGWTFEDRTTRGGGPSQTGAGHWRADGTYDFDFDGGAFAHRAAAHTNDGVNDGPDPLLGAWSVWIGTNLYLNPEHCGWTRAAGYGDGWSQGLARRYRFRDAPGPGEYATPAPGSALALSFFHRYATETGFDTAWVEVSWDGVTWERTGSAFSGGTRSSPLPAPGGGPAAADLVAWPGGEGDLHVRLRLATDGSFSDETGGGDFLFAWQVDDVRLRVNGTPIDLADFESGMGGWEPRRFEGRDFLLTGDPARPAGRISPLATLACDFGIPCPEACELEGNVLFFFDRDECNPGPPGSQSFARSPAFAIGGAAHPDLDGDGGRLLDLDVAWDHGTGYFEAGIALCWTYWPSGGQGRCPYAPPGGAPGAGTTFDWSRAGGSTCDFFLLGAGPDCASGVLDDLSAGLPAGADSVILWAGGFSQCRTPGCTTADLAVPVLDNLRFGVFDPGTAAITVRTADRYADSFPTADGSILTTTMRSDRAVGGPPSDPGPENPLRWVRGDSALARTAAANAAVFLRFRVDLGPCPPPLVHPFFTAYPPGQWHEAGMDTAPWAAPGDYMTCYHESDPHDGTYWTGTPPANEPCDDILPDGLLTAGSRVLYFYEVRDAASGQVLGTFPHAVHNRPIGTDDAYRSLWLEMTNLPAPAPACDGSYANNVLVVNDFATNGVPGTGTVFRDRLIAMLQGLGLDFDVYDHVATNYSGNFDGIGRREDRPTQQPRPPMNGATDEMLGHYDCIWYYSGLSAGATLSDRTTLSIFGGHPSMDQQKLETWIGGCSGGISRLLVLEGLGWASDIDINTSHGAAFLSRFGVDVLADDYAQDLAANDLRRCARVAGTPLAPGFDGEVFGSGCPDDLPLDVFGAISSGEAVARFVESLESGHDPVSCADDVPRPAWHAIVRKANPNHTCEKSVAMSFPFPYLYGLRCAGQCAFDDYTITGPSQRLLVDLFGWAGRVIEFPIGVGGPPAPRFANALGAPSPNPATPRATIRYSIAERGRVTLRIFDAAGRLVRTLADEVREPGDAAAAWDGTNDAGRQVSSGVYFYELRAPGYAASRKLVVLP